MAHERPLRLQVGADLPIRLLPILCSLAAAGAVLTGAADWPLKFIATGFCLLAGLLIHLLWSRKPPGQLILHRHGPARWHTGDGPWSDGDWLPGAWITNRYAVLPCRSGRRVNRFLVCRRHQQPETFRILASWIRLQPAKEAG